MREFNIVLVTDIAPTSAYTAGAALEMILGPVALSNQLSVIVVGDVSLGDYEIDGRFSLSTSYYFSRPAEYWPRLKFISSIGDRMCEKETAVLVKHIKKIFSQNQPDLIIFVLQGIVMFRIAVEFAQGAIPYATIIWDPYEWWNSSHRQPPKLLSRVNEITSTIYSKGFHIFPSQSFAKHWNMPKDRSAIIYPPISPNLVSTWDFSDEIELVFAGRSYSSGELTCLIAELDQMMWRLDGVPIKFYTYGFNSFPSRPSIINKGWVRHENLTTEISKHHIAILPYPSGKEMKIVSQLSFPNKYISYCAAGLPTIYIGPDYSSVYDFAIKSGFALSIQDIESKFALNLSTLLTNYRDYKESAIKIYEKNFSRSLSTASLNELLSFYKISELDQNSVEIRNLSPRKISELEKIPLPHNSRKLQKLISGITRLPTILKIRLTRIISFLKTVPRRLLAFFVASNWISVQVVRRFLVNKFRSGI